MGDKNRAQDPQCGCVAQLRWGTAMWAVFGETDINHGSLEGSPGESSNLLRVIAGSRNRITSESRVGPNCIKSFLAFNWPASKLVVMLSVVAGLRWAAV